jgi:NAD(P)-dependent dehydrogenase (short-subunit alcohol dehydrogenase family)
MSNSATNSAIVTGASGGIGGSIAKRLAKDGFSVVVDYAGNAFTGGHQSLRAFRHARRQGARSQV